MIAQTRPQHGFSKHRAEHIKDGSLILSVLSGGVSIVAQHEPEIGAAVAGPLVIGVAHVALRFFARARIAQDPDAGRLPRANHWIGGEKRIRIAAAANQVRRADEKILGFVARGLGWFSAVQPYDLI